MEPVARERIPGPGDVETNTPSRKNKSVIQRDRKSMDKLIKLYKTGEVKLADIIR